MLSASCRLRLSATPEPQHTDAAAQQQAIPFYPLCMRLPSTLAVRPTSSMSSPSNSGPRLFAISLICAFAALPATLAAQTLPATAPTDAAVAQTQPVPVTAPAVTATRPHRADVAFSGQMLTIRANDSSLHQILSSISHVTGMKITGGVAEQRVFGNYGPDNASTILATLLDGTGVNMLIREDDAHRPTELTLTARSGGAIEPITPQDEEIGAEQPVTPANLQTTPLPGAVLSASPVQASPSAQQPLASGPPSIPQPLNNPLGSPNNVTPTASQIPTANSVPTDSLPTPSTATPPSQGIVDTPNQPSNATTPSTATTPGAITADQVYQQLLQMQKAKAAQSTGTSASPPQ
jgi:hypothetical protein